MNIYPGIERCGDDLKAYRTIDEKVHCCDGCEEKTMGSHHLVVAGLICSQRPFPLSCAFLYTLTKRFHAGLYIR